MRGQNMLPGYICMEKIIILWSDCESWVGGASAPPAPLAQPPLPLKHPKLKTLVNNAIPG